MKSKIKIKKIILSTISLFAFSNVILFSTLDNSLNNSEKIQSINKNLVDNQTSQKTIVPQTSVRTLTPTTLAYKDGNSEANLRNLYPFELRDPGIAETYFKLLNPGGNNSSGAINSWNFTELVNIGLNEMSGSIIITVNVPSYIDSEGSAIDKQGFVTKTFTGLKSNLGNTTLAASKDPTNNVYATDISSGVVQNSFVLTNPLKSAVTTTLEVHDFKGNNKEGILSANISLKNYLLNGQFEVESPVFVYERAGFEKVPGPTTMIPLNIEQIGKVVPSILNREGISTDNYAQYFKLLNTPIITGTIQTTIDDIGIESFDDEKGTVTLSVTISGRYFDSEYLDVRINAGESVTLSIEIGGFQKIEAVSNETTILIIGGSVGAVVIIAIIAIIVFLLKKKQKNKNENLRKQKISEKVSPPGKTSSVSSMSSSSPSSIPTPSSGGRPSSPSGGMPSRPSSPSGGMPSRPSSPSGGMPSRPSSPSGGMPSIPTKK